MASPNVHLVIIAGLAGSGKTSLGYEVCKKTGFGYLDKDTTTGAIVDQMLRINKGPYGIAERDSDYYLNQIRPAEYESLMNSARESISLGISMVITAPFMREVIDPDWRRDLKQDCLSAADRPVRIHYVWVEAPEAVMKRRIGNRNASRDQYKLTNWDEWYANASKVEPPEICFKINCDTDNEAEYRAMEIIDRFALLGAIGFAER